jgi:hypothetical protein
VPLPGFLLKRAMEGTKETATDRTGNQATTINKDGKSLQKSHPGYGFTMTVTETTFSSGTTRQPRKCRQAGSQSETGG